MGDRRLTAAAPYLRSPLAQFHPWARPEGTSPQREFVMAAADYRVRVARWGNRCGKSEIGCVDTLLAALGWHPAFPLKPPLTIWASALDWNLIGQVMWPKFQAYMPQEQVKHVSFLRKNPPIPLQIEFKNGSVIDFKSADSGRRKYQGAQIDLIWLDEEHPADVVEESQARLLDSGGLLTVTATPIMRAKWLQSLEKRDTTFVNRASLFDAAEAGIVNKQAVLDYADGLPERQRRVRVFGDVVAAEGAVYPNFSRETHVAVPRNGALWIGDRRVCEWPPHKTWRRYAGADFGYHVPTAVVHAHHDPEHGRLFVNRCWYATHVRASKWAEYLKPELDGIAAPVICDRGAAERAEWHAAGIKTAAKKGWTTPIPGIELVERLFELRPDGFPALVLVEDCAKHPQLGRCDTKKLAWELENYHYPPTPEDKPAARDLPVKVDDHACDALRYLCELVATIVKSVGTTALDRIRPNF